MSAWQKLRRNVLTPDIAETTIEVRGFHVKDESARIRLEKVGSSFLAGFGEAAESAGPAQLAGPLTAAVETDYQGFAYEGAAMAYGIRDAMAVRRHDYVAGMLDRHDEHVYMAYVGVGWAMARLPRPFWRRLHAPDPLLRWLVLDGYGFHQAYFHTARYVHRAEREQSIAWPGDPGNYAVRAIDQGIGRATWFVAGTDPRVLLRYFATFAPERHADLFAGAGLAATYAGGATDEELRLLRDGAGEHRGDLAQGSAFAAAARLRAGLLTEHNERATRILCGTGARAAAEVTDEARRDLPGDGPVPAFEVWRRRITDAFRATARETEAERA